MLRTRKPLDEGVPVWGSQFRRIFNEYAEATARFTRIEDSLQRLLTRREPRQSGGLNPFFDAFILSFTQPDPNVYQWIYDWVEVGKVGRGYGTTGVYEHDSEKHRSGTQNGYNYSENDMPSIFHASGVNLEKLDLFPRFFLGPCPPGRVVQGRIFNVIEDEESFPEFWFDFQNVPNGDCGV